MRTPASSPATRCPRWPGSRSAAGRADADALLAAAREHAERAENLPVLVPVLVAEVERAWLTGRPALARAAVALLPRTERPGRAWQRGELLRYLRRLGEHGGAVPGLPATVFAAGLRGDWRAAADAVGGDRRPVRAGAGARRLRAAAADARRARACSTASAPPPPPRWCAAGCGRSGSSGSRAGRSPPPGATRPGSPAGRSEILRLLVDGLTNAEIAARLVVSVRTVDHHVSAVLQKLGVPSRQAARDAAAALDLPS